MSLGYKDILGDIIIPFDLNAVSSEYLCRIIHKSIPKCQYHHVLFQLHLIQTMKLVHRN